MGAVEEQKTLKEYNKVHRHKCKKKVLGEERDKQERDGERNKDDYKKSE